VGLDEILEDEFDSGESPPTIGAVQLLTQPVERLAEEEFVGLKVEEFLGKIERIVFVSAAARGTLALDLVRSLGPPSPIFCGEVVRGGSALEQATFLAS
jgi:hypothetical protein